MWVIQEKARGQSWDLSTHRFLYIGGGYTCEMVREVGLISGLKCGPTPQGGRLSQDPTHQ